MNIDLSGLEPGLPEVEADYNVLGAEDIVREWIDDYLQSGAPNRMESEAREIHFTRFMYTLWCDGNLTTQQSRAPLPAPLAQCTRQALREQSAQYTPGAKPEKTTLTWADPAPAYKDQLATT